MKGLYMIVLGQEFGTRLDTRDTTEGVLNLAGNLLDDETIKSVFYVDVNGKVTYHVVYFDTKLHLKEVAT